MEGTPLHLSHEDIGRAIATVEHVRSVHDLHVWTPESTTGTVQFKGSDA